MAEIKSDLTDKLFKKICQYVYDHARINLTEKKRELVRARLGKVIRTKGFSGYKEFYAYMEDDTSGKALQDVLNAISTNLTSFFREPKHFNFLEQTLLPQLAINNDSKTLRAWSAGCSTGEEIYSIALTIAEHLPDFQDWDIKLLASDIDTTVVNTGAAGIYNKERLGSINMSKLQKYFQRSSENKDIYKVKPVLSNMVAFRFLNLMGEWPFKKQFDFIFCRNVMIYFDKATQQQLITRYYNQLKPGGYLFIGHSEGLTGIEHNFSYSQPTVYRK